MSTITWTLASDEANFVLVTLRTGLAQARVVGQQRAGHLMVACLDYPLPADEARAEIVRCHREEAIPRLEYDVNEQQLLVNWVAALLAKLEAAAGKETP